MQRTVLAATILGLAALGTAWAAPTGPTPVRFSYTRGQGAEGCPDQEMLMSSVSALMGHAPWDSAASRRLDVLVQQRGGRLVARIELRDGDAPAGTRDLSSAHLDCKELAAAMELAISIAIDPLGASRQRPVAAPRQPSQLPDRELPRRSRTDGRPAPQGLQLAVGVGGAVTVGSSPSVAGGVELQAGLRWPHLSLALEGRIDLPAHREVTGGQLGSWMGLGSALGCGHLSRFFGCGLVSVGALRLSGHERVVVEDATQLYVAGGLRLGAGVRVVSLLSLRAHADLLVPFNRISVVEASSEAQLWEMPPVSGVFGLSAVGTFF
jgi:hypothetical protein